MTPNLAKDYPKVPDMLGISLVSLSVIIMCYSYLVPVIPILIYFGLWLPLSLYKRTFILKPTGDILLALTFPFLCFISFLWSDHLGQTLYSGVQFLVMAICLLIITRVVSYTTFLKGLTLGITIVLLMSLFKGLAVQGSDILHNATAGFFGSKNQLGYVSVIGILSAFTLVYSDLKRPQKMLFGVLPIFICLLGLVLSHSATSLISIIMALALITAAWIITKLPMAMRVAVLILTMLFILTTATSILAFNLDPMGLILEAFGKDRTLTGRTDLWEVGMTVGSENPVLGLGYNAFWVHNNPIAEQLWKDFHIPGRTGFNFHNLYVESYVSLGIIGTCVAILLMLYFFLHSFYYVIKDGLNIYTGLFFGVSSLAIIRSFSEVELFGPFGLQVFVYLSLIVRVSQYKQARQIHNISTD